MNTRNKVISFGVAALLTTFGAVTPARANLEACGGVYLDASAAASCEVVPTETCTARCEPVAVELVCAARLTTQCTGGCTATAEASCTSTCEQSCVPECTSQPSQPPNCMGLCMSNCQQGCTATCADSSGGECRSSCAQCCSVDCHAQCDKQPEPACEPVCAVACSGSCTGKANIDCQVSCQSSLFSSCKTEEVQVCKNECTTTGAAIFCNGQFLASAGNLQACADELQAEFNVTLDVSIAASGSCDNGVCQGVADAKSELGCSVGTARNAAHSSAAGGLMMLLGLGLWQIRRTRRPD